MSLSSKLVALDLGTFVERVSARSPTPGGGSVAALVGALGASAASMAFRYATREGESAAPAYMAGRADELDGLRDLLVELVDRDAEAFENLLRSEAGTSREKALESALEAPSEAMEFALAALRLLSVGLRNVPVRLHSECAVAAHALRAAVEGGAAVLAADLSLLESRARDERRSSSAVLRSQAAKLQEEIEGALRGPGG